MSWTAGRVDTRDYVSGSGALPLTLRASNAAGVSSSPSETLNVDNDPVAVSLSTPNDPNPTLWVNHAVRLQAAASAGPSGVGGTNCSVDQGAARLYTAAGVAVDGDGTHTVTCTAWNQAVGPQGQPNSATSSMAVKIDEAPPAVALEPENPADPTQLVADTGDSESGVASGQIEMAPAAGGPWTPLPTQFDGQHILAHVDDAGLSGAYTFRPGRLRQRRQLRLDQQDAGAAGAGAGRLRGQPRADLSHGMPRCPGEACGRRTARGK